MEEEEKVPDKNYKTDEFGITVSSLMEKNDNSIYWHSDEFVISKIKHNPLERNICRSYVMQMLTIMLQDK